MLIISIDFPWTSSSNIIGFSEDCNKTCTPLTVRWKLCAFWFAYTVFLIVARQFGLGSKMTWTLPTHNLLIPLLKASITRNARSYSFWPFLSNFVISDYKHLQWPYKVLTLKETNLNFQIGIFPIMASFSHFSFQKNSLTLFCFVEKN